MATTQQISIDIKTTFNDAGLRRAFTGLKKLMASTRAFQSSMVSGTQFEQFQKNTDNMSRLANQAGLTLSKTAKNTLAFKDSLTGTNVPMATAAAKMSVVDIQTEKLHNSLFKTNNMLKRTANAGFKDINTMLPKIKKRTKKVTKAMDEQRQQFDMNALSMLFFGMAIQRVFQGILVSSIGTFNKVTEGSTMAGQGIAALKANMELLKFSIGEALATAILPFIPRLIEIIQASSDWVQQNKKLVAGLILGGFILGTVAMLYGLLKLGITGVIRTFAMLGDGLRIVIGRVGFGGLITAITTAIVWIIILAAAWKAVTTAFDEFPELKDRVANTFTEMGDTIMGVVSDILASIFNIGLQMIGLDEQVVTSDEAWAGLGLGIVSTFELIGRTIQIVVGLVGALVGALLLVLEIIVRIGSAFNHLMTGQLSKLKEDFTKPLSDTSKNLITFGIDQSVSGAQGIGDIFKPLKSQEMVEDENFLAAVTQSQKKFNEEQGKLDFSNTLQALQDGTIEYTKQKDAIQELSGEEGLLGLKDVIPDVNTAQDDLIEKELAIKEAVKEANDEIERQQLLLLDIEGQSQLVADLLGIELDRAGI